MQLKQSYGNLNISVLVCVNRGESCRFVVHRPIFTEC